MANTFTQYWQKRFNLWLNRRMPPAAKQQLSGNNIFILPSKFGLVYLVFVVILFLLGTNYQNNLIILLSLILASLFITTMLHSFFNLSGLIIQSKSAPSSFAEQTTQAQVDLHTNKPRYHLHCSFESHPNTEIANCHHGKNKLQIPLTFQQRGLHKLPRLRITSEYPLGLFTTWTRLDLNLTATIYPKAIMPKQLHQTQPQAISSENINEQGHQQGSEDFFQLKSYQQGEPWSQVAWKQAARGQGLLSKKYTSPQSNDIWLDLKSMPANTLEGKLSNLSALILEYEKQQQAFGFILGEHTIQPNTSHQHSQQCLTLLAKY